ncbi:MAG TPA: OmpH family outer membrane protein [Longimicrobium sp.]|nr:OmpH family outer membrane protein [Longimicrobium sp.]
MKRFFSFVLAGAAALALSAPAQGQALKIGYINSQRVLQETPAFADVRATLEREFGPMRTELDSMEARLQRAGDDLERQGSTLTQAAREQRQQQFQQQYQQYQQRAQAIQQQVQTREQALVAPVMQRIRGVLEEVRQAGGFSYIIDPPDGLVVAVDPALDVTNDVIRRLGGTPAPQPAGTTP